MIRNILRLTVLAFFAAVPAQVASAGGGSYHHDGGPARGHVVVWDHYANGKPTGHLQGTLHDDYGRPFARVRARLEHDGYVRGVAKTVHGRTHHVSGYWRFDRYNHRGYFDLKFDLDYHHKVELKGHFRGRHAQWHTYWQKKRRHY